MSAPLAKILNKQYPNQPADLLDAKVAGPVGGYHKNHDSNNQSWEIVVVGGNQITIRNGTTGTFAIPAFEAPGGPVIGGFQPYRWRQTPVPGGWYQITTFDGRFAWFLTGPEDYAPIVLRPSDYQGQDAQWGYEPTPRVG